MAEIVFNDEQALRDLEAITHPAVRRRVDDELAVAARQAAPFVVIEAIKLVEGGLAQRCDEVWLIDCPPAVQRDRLQRRGTDPADADRRIATQGDDFVGRTQALLPSTVRRRVLPTHGTLGRRASRRRSGAGGGYFRSLTPPTSAGVAR